MKNKNYFLKCLLLAIGTGFSFSLKMNINGVIVSSRDTNVFIALLISLFCFWFYTKYLNIPQKKTFTVIAGCLSILMIFGYSYDITGSAKLIYANLNLIIISLIKLISLFFLFRTALNLLYEKVVNLHLIDKKPLKKIGELFSSHPFLFSFVVILLCYIPYLIAFYPGIMCNDPINQIKEFLGIPTRYLDSVIALNPDVTITNFNPVLHTLLLGSTFKLGMLLGNNNIGMFLYTIIQTIIMISIFSYAVYYLKKEGVPKILLYITLGIFALTPVFPFYALANVKDSLFSVFILLYIIQLYDLIKNETSLRGYVYLFLSAMLVILFRNNGIYTVILSLPFILIVVKNKRVELIITLTMIILTTIFYTRILLPSLGISNTSIREMLSIPFQQTARLVKYHEDIIESHDKELIDKVLIYDTLADRYETRISDPVKNRYNKEATKEDLKAYFQVWFKYLLKKPGVYIDATIANVYGYFYPDTSWWYIYYNYNDRVISTEMEYSYNALENVRYILQGFGVFFPRIPLIGMFVNIGFIVWSYVVMLGILIVNKTKKYIPLLLPAFSLILVCIASPVNTYFRYAQPFIFSLPVVAFLLYNVLKKEKN